jgi:hypothetical protein
MKGYQERAVKSYMVGIMLDSVIVTSLNWNSVQARSSQQHIAQNPTTEQLVEH